MNLTLSNAKIIDDPLETSLTHKDAMSLSIYNRPKKESKDYFYTNEDDGSVEDLAFNKVNWKNANLFNKTLSGENRKRI